MATSALQILTTTVQVPFMAQNINAEYLQLAHLQECRFTDSARRTLGETVGFALARRIHGVVPHVALLWSLLVGERKLGLIVLEACGLDLSEARNLRVAADWANCKVARRGCGLQRNCKPCARST